MRYLTTFNRRLEALRQKQSLSISDLARMIDVDDSRVRSWEQPDSKQRCVPNVEELMDLCFATGTSLDSLLDLEDGDDAGQMELPGLTFSEGNDLSRVLETLEREVRRLQPSEEEVELLRRFRNATPESRRMILQLLGDGAQSTKE
ncbi:helix-turn-helix protein [Tamilnaduibacter salinus]|uniref:Helix-turn-helix protein n=1 Tax=Tamilnaduibacter salinus TaxID=1484056 RepID=A0A2A2I061_9GAMM|nr:helix-turn-helix transcriptional regulator [Tamilnaduibacter salinus]PAV24798.1 transcriptional regulator [Tamilnaduibacter salinus]PVY78338.1 helix-turn-helix protein [Tamilnaduibacter salinus]